VPLASDARILVQVTQRSQPKGIPPALPAMLGRVVDHVAALAERFQVRWRTVARVMIEMRAGQDDVGHPNLRQCEAALHRNPFALVRSPARRIGVPPASIAEMCDPPKVRPTALLAAPAGTLEPDRARQLLPVDRVEPAIFGADRHRISMSHATGLGKQYFTVCCRFVSPALRAETTN